MSSIVEHSAALVDPSIGAAPVAVAAHDRSCHFRNDHLHADLEGRCVCGGAIRLGGQAIKLVPHVGATAVLPRPLTGDVGLIAMVDGFTGSSVSSKTSACPSAPSNAPKSRSPCSGSTSPLSVLLASFGTGSRPAVAWFYGEARLVAANIALCATRTLRRPRLTKRRLSPLGSFGNEAGQMSCLIDR